MKEYKSAHEIEAMILSQMIQYEAPEGILITIVPDGDSWRPVATVTDAHEVPEHAEWIAILMQVADHFKSRYDLMT